MIFSTTWVALGMVLVLLLALVTASATTRATHGSGPSGLQDAELVYRETMFRIDSPIRLVARVDRVYRKPNGALVLVELKTRRLDRTYQSDIIQLSAQRLAIEVGTGELVEPYAFVAVLSAGGEVQFRRVQLLDAAGVISIHRRRQAILTIQAVPAYVASVSACRSCALRSKCDRF